MVDAIDRAMNEFPVVALVLGVAYLAVRYTRQVLNQAAANAKAEHDGHLRSKQAEIDRLVEHNRRLEQLLVKTLADHYRERGRLYKLLQDRAEGEG